MIDQPGEKWGRERARLAHAFMAKPQRIPPREAQAPLTAVRSVYLFPTSAQSEHWSSLHVDRSDEAVLHRTLFTGAQFSDEQRTPHPAIARLTRQPS